MTTLEPIKKWWHVHEAWVLIAIVCSAFFGAGWVCSNLAIRSDYQRETQRLQDSYKDSLDAKDKLIANLAGNAAVSATKAAGAAQAAAQSADSAASKDKKQLEKLK